jgi:WG containing repeat
MDNGPDSFHDGLVRTVQNGRYGFANREGQIAMPTIYDGAMNFEKGLAALCQSCKIKCGGPNCEYHSFAEGRWFQINTKGEIAAPLAPEN